MTVCGIDFGTSNSAIALAESGKVRLAPVEDTQVTLPSALFYPRGRAALYGRLAQQTFFDGHDGRFMRSLKRMLGTELMNWGTIVNDRPRRFDELIGGFIGYLKEKGEAAAGQPLESVVMGRPVHFVDGDPGADYAAEQQLTRIAQAAGFKHIAFQYEPIAAAFAHEQHLSGETLAIVADIGGGTSDFTVIRLGDAPHLKADRRQDILGNSGIRTGGNDFDKSFSLARFMPALGYDIPPPRGGIELPRAPFHDLSEWSKINFVYTPKIVQDMRRAVQNFDTTIAQRLLRVLEDELGHRLLSEVETAKIALSDKSAHHVDLDFITPAFHLNVTEDGVAAAILPHIDTITATLYECLQQAQCHANDITLCILTGGPTAMPRLARALTSCVPQAQVRAGERLSSVATGLGHTAAVLFQS